MLTTPLDETIRGSKAVTWDWVREVNKVSTLLLQPTQLTRDETMLATSLLVTLTLQSSSLLRLE